MTLDTSTATKPKVPGPLQKAGLLDEAQIYEAMWDATGRRVLPREVDELYIWEIATLLGVGDEVVRPEASRNGQASSEDKHEYLRARVAHARGQGPRPEAKPIAPETFQALGGALS